MSDDFKLSLAVFNQYLRDRREVLGDDADLQSLAEEFAHIGRDEYSHYLKRVTDCIKDSSDGAHLQTPIDNHKARSATKSVRSKIDKCSSAKLSKEAKSMNWSRESIDRPRSSIRSRSKCSISGAEMSKAGSKILDKETDRSVGRLSSYSRNGLECAEESITSINGSISGSKRSENRSKRLVSRSPKSRNNSQKTDRSRRSMSGSLSGSKKGSEASAKRSQKSINNLIRKERSKKSISRSISGSKKPRSESKRSVSKSPNSRNGLKSSDRSKKSTSRSISGSKRSVVGSKRSLSRSPKSSKSVLKSKDSSGKSQLQALLLRKSKRIASRKILANDDDDVLYSLNTPAVKSKKPASTKKAIKRASTLKVINNDDIEDDDGDVLYSLNTDAVKRKKTSSTKKATKKPTTSKLCGDDDDNDVLYFLNTDAVITKKKPATKKANKNLTKSKVTKNNHNDDEDKEDDKNETLNALNTVAVKASGTLCKTKNVEKSSE